MSRHTLSVLVENKPGVLTRVAGLFARRAFNIHSLAVGPTEHPEISRMTIVVDVEDVPLEQVTKQLNKLIQVIKIVELEPETSVQRLLKLIKVHVDDRTRSSVIETVNLFRAHVVDVAPDSLVVEAVGTKSKLDALTVALEPYGIKEIVTSGRIAIGRGPKSITDRKSIGEKALKHHHHKEHELHP
jgi:acetolactate synthase I/III small subunit